jgi:hypothetical protein
MRFGTWTLALFALLLGSTVVASEADAKSCSSYAIITGYDSNANTVELKFGRGRVQKFFPRPEGTPADSTKVPGPCTGKVTKHKKLVVKPTGGRMSVTQVRSNFEGKMLNDTDDAAWLGGQLKQLIDGKTEVVIVVRPGMGKDAPLEITTLYLPITPEEEAEIKRLESQAEEL